MTANSPKRILLLSAYDADSHQSWRKGLVRNFDDFEWTVLTLPPRYFSWRVRGNSLSWAFGAREILEKRYDLIVATSMVDLSSLRGFVPSLASIPTLLYFHENQFAYPSSEQAHISVEPQILNLYSALCADRLLFNTHFNCDSFLDGVNALMRRLPDQVPKGLVERLQKRAQVLPVPLADNCYRSQQAADELWGEAAAYENGRPLRILWAARWEYDKGPELLLLILRQLKRAGVEFRLCLLGQKFRRTPAEFAVIESEFANELVQIGYEDDGDRYRRWLSSTDLVLSTAEHEFQGLSVLEAMAAGATPVLPNRLSYPELVDSSYLYPVKGRPVEQQAIAAVELIKQLATDRPAVRVPDFRWSTLAPQYRQEFERLFLVC